MTTSKRYDVLLSYSGENEAFVESLARHLRGNACLTFWFRPWRSIPGKSLQERMEDTLHNAHSCAVFLSSSEVKGWQNDQMRAAIQARVEDEPGHRIIPVLLPGHPSPQTRPAPVLAEYSHPVAFQAIIQRGF